MGLLPTAARWATQGGLAALVFYGLGQWPPEVAALAGAAVTLAGILVALTVPRWIQERGS